MLLEMGGEENLPRIISSKERGKLCFFHVVNGNLARADINHRETVMGTIRIAGKSTQKVASARSKKGIFNQRTRRDESNYRSLENRTLSFL